jgi:prepilin-type N-terminal cleavage/methylation domain-containing protein
MENQKKNKQSGFSLMEMLIAMTIVIVLLAVASLVFGRALGVRSRESSRTDALTAAQAALNVMSREISNAGYGLASDSFNTIHNNGIVLADSNSSRLRVRANTTNTNLIINDAGEDVTYYFDAAAKSIVRHDPAQNPSTTYLVNQISNVSFSYFNYTGSSSTPTETSTPTADTSRVKITVTVQMAEVQGQPTGRTVTLTSFVTLRNSDYMLSQY